MRQWRYCTSPMDGKKNLAAPATVGGLKHLRRLIRFATPYRGQIILAALALMASTGMVLSLGLVIRGVVDSGFDQQTPGALDQWLGIMALTVVLYSLVLHARFRLVVSLGEHLVADIRAAVYRHLLRLDPLFFETRRPGELISRLTADATELQQALSVSFPMTIRGLLQVGGGLVLLVMVDPTLAGMALLVGPLVMAPAIMMSRRVRALAREAQDALANANAHVEQSITQIRTVLAFAQEDADAARYGAANQATRLAGLKRIRLKAILLGVTVLISFGAVTLVLWAGGHGMLAGRLSGGDLIAFVFFAAVVGNGISGFAEVWGDVMRAAGATERLLGLLDERPSLHAEPDAAQPSEEAEAAPTLVFDQVSFSYPARADIPAINDVSFTIQPGETVALVGRSGAGKSTIFHLCLRFFDPARGEIRLEGSPLRALDPRAPRQRIGLVPQEPDMLADTIATNIRFGAPNADDAAVETAARAAFAHDFITALPDGYNTHVGERGVRLSGGQKQRLAIARVFLKQPRLLLLDEATSALDSESEIMIQQALKTLRGHTTVLVIAHRLATAAAANRLLVIDSGQLVSQGTHAELLTSSPVYASFAKLQLMA